MINRVILTGRLTTDIELRKTNDGIPYTFFTVAVGRRGNTDQTDFIACVAWRGTAEFMNQYLNKGSLVGIEGRLEVFTQQKDGQYETRTTVQVSNLESLETRAQAEARTAEQRINPAQPAQAQTQQPMTFANEPQFDTNTTTPVTNTVSAPEVVNANDINLDDIKF